MLVSFKEPSVLVRVWNTMLICFFPQVVIPPSLRNDDKTFGDLACEYREKLLKAMAGKGDQSASSYRARTLLGLGLCEVRRETLGVTWGV